jgi:hypothetical protein
VPSIVKAEEKSECGESGGAPDSVTILPTPVGSPSARILLPMSTRLTFFKIG